MRIADLAARCAYTFGLFILALSSGAQGSSECAPSPSVTHFYAKGWGLDERNQRSSRESKLTSDNVQRLELAWSFGLDGEGSPRSYPAITEDTVFIGSDGGTLYALSREDGCIRWKFEADSNIRSAVVIGQVSDTDSLLFFGTGGGFVYAVNALTGKLSWRRKVDENPYTKVTGSPVFHGDILYVPVSSHEPIPAWSPFFDCCEFRGSLLALAAVNGDVIWRRYTIKEPAVVIEDRYLFGDELGPAGASVWSAPTIDEDRQQIYFGTSQNYTDAVTETSDAIMALDLDDGSVKWVRQATPNDAFNLSCFTGPFGINCPDEADNLDLDFGAPPVLVRQGDGTDVLLAGQKSGVLFAIHPDTGEVLWSKKLGRGGILAGIHWGMAVDERSGVVFVPISNRHDFLPHNFEKLFNAALSNLPVLYALRIDDGEILWSVPGGDCEQGGFRCYPGVSAAVTLTNDVVIAGSLDGILRIHDSQTGELVWSYNTRRSFDASNDVPTHGGSIDVHGAMVADDMLFITSGYGASPTQASGNAFLAFRLNSTETGVADKAVQIPIH